MGVPVYRADGFVFELTAGPTGVSFEGALFAWGVAVTSILHGMAERLEPEQRRLAREVAERWAQTKALWTRPCDGPIMFLAAESDALHRIFGDAYGTAALVRAIRPMLPHHAEEQERDAKLVSDLQDFCEERMAWLQENRGVGDIGCDRGMFEQLDYHVAQLMRVVLGNGHMAYFITEYDRAMDGLRRADALARAPLN